MPENPATSWITAAEIQQLTGFEISQYDLFQAQVDVNVATNSNPSVKFSPQDVDWLRTMVLQQAIHAPSGCQCVFGTGVRSRSRHGSSESVDASRANDILCIRARAASRNLSKMVRTVRPIGMELVNSRAAYLEQKEIMALEHGGGDGINGGIYQKWGA